MYVGRLAALKKTRAETRVFDRVSSRSPSLLGRDRLSATVHVIDRHSGIVDMGVGLGLGGKGRMGISWVVGFVDGHGSFPRSSHG